MDATPSTRSLRSVLVLALLALLAGCDRRSAPTGRSSSSAREVPMPLRMDVPPARTPPPPPPPLELDLQPVGVDSGSSRTLEGPGIRVVVRLDRQVEVHTTDRWDGGVDELYESCAFVRTSLPALRRALSEERVAVLVRACGDVRPGERPPALPSRPAPARPAPAR
jgi:hypothetical protein